ETFSRFLLSCFESSKADFAVAAVSSFFRESLRRSSETTFVLVLFPVLSTAISPYLGFLLPSDDEFSDSSFVFSAFEFTCMIVVDPWGVDVFWDSEFSDAIDASVTSATVLSKNSSKVPEIAKFNFITFVLISSASSSTTGFHRGVRYDKNVACVDEAFNGSKNRLSMELPTSSFGTIHEVLRYSSRFAN
ncbi:hypothetical protein ALC62_02044, partial [Cyphomyrmex costatus]